jgi:hypothetical protein
MHTFEQDKLTERDRYDQRARILLVSPVVTFFDAEGTAPRPAD